MFNTVAASMMNSLAGNSGMAVLALIAVSALLIAIIILGILILPEHQLIR